MGPPLCALYFLSVPSGAEIGFGHGRAHCSSVIRIWYVTPFVVAMA